MISLISANQDLNISAAEVIHFTKLLTFRSGSSEKQRETTLCASPRKSSQLSRMYVTTPTLSCSRQPRHLFSAFLSNSPHSEQHIFFFCFRSPVCPSPPHCHTTPTYLSPPAPRLNEQYVYILMNLTDLCSIRRVDFVAPERSHRFLNQCTTTFPENDRPLTWVATTRTNPTLSSGRHFPQT